MMFTAAPAMGPTLSGIIIDHTHWARAFRLYRAVYAGGDGVGGQVSDGQFEQHQPSEDRYVVGRVVDCRLRRIGLCEQ